MFFPHTFLSESQGNKGVCAFLLEVYFQFFSRRRKFRLKLRFDMFEGREKFIRAQEFTCQGF